MPLKRHEDNSHFISLSDMMTALMMIFLFISVAIIHNTQKQTVVVREIVETYSDEQNNLYRDFRKEFEKDLSKWQAKINPEDLSIVFTSPDVLFDTGKDTLKPKFKEMLMDFFPRYIKIIQMHKDHIQEVRIEGYTDTNGLPGQTIKESYFYNMKLSQDRTRSVLEYCLGLPEFTSGDFDYLKEVITANGLSFSHLIADNGVENKSASRRVEFRVLMKSDDKIKNIIQELK